MTIEELQTRAVEVAVKYRQKNEDDGHAKWDASAYMAGFVGDVGDLSKLIMARSNLRHIDDVDKKIAHELRDCLWSVLVLAHHLEVDIEQEFTNTMKELDARLAA